MFSQAIFFNDILGPGVMERSTGEAGVMEGSAGEAEVIGAEMDISTSERFARPRRKRKTTGGVTCCVPGCYNNNREDRRDVHFHALPKNPATYRLWMTRIGRPLTWKPSKHTRICGNHFLGRRKSISSPHPVCFPRREEFRSKGRRVPSITVTSASLESIDVSAGTDVAMDEDGGDGQSSGESGDKTCEMSRDKVRRTVHIFLDLDIHVARKRL